MSLEMTLIVCPIDHIQTIAEQSGDIKQGQYTTQRKF
jgi:hypothetical protein